MADKLRAYRGLVEREVAKQNKLQDLAADCVKRADLIFEMLVKLQKVVPVGPLTKPIAELEAEVGAALKEVEGVRRVPLLELETITNEIIALREDNLSGENQSTALFQKVVAAVDTAFVVVMEGMHALGTKAGYYAEVMSTCVKLTEFCAAKSVLDDASASTLSAVENLINRRVATEEEMKILSGRFAALQELLLGLKDTTEHPIAVEKVQQTELLWAKCADVVRASKEALLVRVICFVASGLWYGAVLMALFATRNGRRNCGSWKRTFASLLAFLMYAFLLPCTLPL